MKILTIIIVTIFCVGTCFSQDSCKVKKIVVNLNKQKQEGFVTDVRLDNFDDNFIREFDEKVENKLLKFSNDYTGSLKNPGSLFGDIDFSSYDLINASLSFTDKNNVQRIVFSPFKLSQSVNSNILLNTKIRLAVRNNITTIGFAIGGDNNDQKLKRIVKKREQIFSKGEYYIPDCFSLKTDQEKYRQINKEIADSLLYLYDVERTKHVLKWTAGYSVQLFQFLSTKSENAIADSLNFYGLKANVISLGGSYSYLNGKFQVTADYNLINSRKSAVKGQEKIVYHGLQFSTSYRVFPFLRGKKLRTNEDFVKSLFVPGIHLGFLYEYKSSNGDLIYIEDGIQKSNVYTPYLDFLVTPSSAFRIGFPIIKNKTVTEAKTAQIAASLQYSFKLSNLN